LNNKKKVARKMEDLQPGTPESAVAESLGDPEFIRAEDCNKGEVTRLGGLECYMRGGETGFGGGYAYMVPSYSPFVQKARRIREKFLRGHPKVIEAMKEAGLDPKKDDLIGDAATDLNSYTVIMMLKKWAPKSGFIYNDKEGREVRKTAAEIAAMSPEEARRLVATIFLPRIDMAAGPDPERPVNMPFQAALLEHMDRISSAKGLEIARLGESCLRGQIEAPDYAD
jgi:hypothetical protein